MLKPKRKSLIESAIENNKQPTRSRSTNDLLLPLGSKRYARLQQRGKTTPAGRFYFSQTKTGPETFDIQGTVVQRGSTEMLLTSGKARVLRRLVGSEYQYTHLGKKYFDAKKYSTWSMYPPSSKRHIPAAPAVVSWCPTMPS